ncbi:S8/S53 family peptidase [Flavobacterium sp.]|uniref:S8/S53 family peptidase n=8 Tax=Flavobacterium sp. TaxID=239 RepID=UPI004047EB6C
MIKNYFFSKVLLTFFIGLLNLNAQTESEKSFLSNTYDKELTLRTIDFLSFNEFAREERVLAYIKVNNASRDFFSNGVKYRIYDIVNDSPVFLSTDNKYSAFALKTNKLYPSGTLGLSLTGLGMSVGVWDGGWALSAHQEFQLSGSSRISNPDYPSVNPIADLHATHVVGTVCAKGVTTNARGMAYESSVKSYDWSGDEIEVANEAASGLLVSNHSYGVPVYNDDNELNVPTWYMGCYNDAAVDWDQIAYSFPYYLSVHSAGNSGQESYTGGFAAGLDKLTGNKNAKNLLIVANANPTVHPITGIMSSMSINASSSQGPTDDGRIKPDIAADGTSVFSTSNASTSTYDTLSGTSMASPSVAGSLILLQQLNNNLNSTYLKSATLKGLVCHTAVDDVTNVGPDPYFGWGLMDTNAVATLLINENSATPTTVIEEYQLNQGGTYTINVQVSNPKLLKATICWTDVPGTSQNSQLNSTTPVLVNDLDLRIIKGAETNFPWKFDLANITSPAIKGDNLVDNVEKVEVENALGIYTIQVSHKGTLSGTNQAYSLIISGYDQIVLNNADFSTNSIAVYPNPTSDKININSSKNAILSYQIFDMQGRFIAPEKINNLTDFSIDMSSLNTGVYFIQLNSEEGVSRHKIVKK